MAPDVSLVSPTQPNLDDTKPSPDVHKPDVLIKSEPRETINIIVTKRKYRRHPKVCSLFTALAGDLSS